MIYFHSFELPPLAAAVEGHEPHDEDESSEGDEGQRVAGDLHHLPVLEATSSGAQDVGTYRVTHHVRQNLLLTLI